VPAQLYSSQPTITTSCLGDDTDFREVADGVYCHATPAGVAHLSVNSNRGLILKVKNQDDFQECLLMSGVPSNFKKAVKKVRKVELLTGLTLDLIVGSGDYHHLSLKHWLDEFPLVKVILSGPHFGKTKNGADLLLQYGTRVEVVKDSTKPSLSLRPYRNVRMVLSEAPPFQTFQVE
jgi:hypothetical protein